ncbi:MAG: HPr(Ser) kinase/phosphatase [Acidobacteriota bacterium]
MTDESTDRLHPQLSVCQLMQGTQGELALEILAGRSGLERVISEPRIQKPGLALAGFLEYLHRGRTQVLGNSEITFLKEMEPARQKVAVRKLVGYGVACFVITKGLEPPHALVDACEAANLPLLRTRIVSSMAIYALGRFLERELSPTIQIHGCLLDVYGLGVLLLGDSGIGKSECALDLIVRGHRIVSDDVVVIRRLGDTLSGSSPEMTRYHMELRGIGIINVKDLFGVAAVRRVKDVDMVIRLDRWREGKVYERLGVDERTNQLLGISLPYVEMPVAPGRHLSVLVEVTSRNQLLKLKGYFPAQNLVKEADRRLLNASPARAAAAAIPAPTPPEGVDEE